MYFNYVLVCKSNDCNQYKSFKIKLPFYTPSGKYKLSMEGKCYYSYFYPKFKIVNFMYFDTIANKRILPYIYKKMQMFRSRWIFFQLSSELF